MSVRLGLLILTISFTAYADSTPTLDPELPPSIMIQPCPKALGCPNPISSSDPIIVKANTFQDRTTPIQYLLVEYSAAIIRGEPKRAERILCEVKSRINTTNICYAPLVQGLLAETTSRWANYFQWLNESFAQTTASDSSNAALPLLQYAQDCIANQDFTTAIALINLVLSSHTTGHMKLTESQLNTVKALLVKANTNPTGIPVSMLEDNTAAHAKLISPNPNSNSAPKPEPTPKATVAPVKTPTPTAAPLPSPKPASAATAQATPAVTPPPTQK
ncbi:MAG: hypothetical protein V4490_05560 [Pseudomonadota bacterium]